MAGIALVGYYGDKEIARDHFLPVTLRGEDWNGSPCYQQSYFVELPIQNNVGDLVTALPRDVVRFQRRPEKRADEIFSLENEYLIKAKEFEERKRKEKEEREARQKEMDAALAVSREERAERKRAAEEAKKKEEEAREKKITKMQEVTGAPETACRRLLKENSWDVQESTRLYYEQEQAEQQRKQEIAITFQTQDYGAKVTRTFRETTTVFELYQVAYSLVHDKNRGFEMRIGGSRLLGESDFCFPLKSMGLDGGKTYAITIRYC